MERFLLRHAKFKSYYWTQSQSEYATDILFRDAASLEEIYRPVLRHAMENFRSHDVLLLGPPHQQPL